MHIAEQGWRIVEAARGQGDLRLPAGCAVGHTLLHQFADAVELHLRDDRADVNGFVERGADAESAHAILDFGD